MKVFLCLIVGLTINSCSINEDGEELKSCKSFFEERFYQISIGNRKLSQSGNFSIDLNNLFKEAKELLNTKKYSEINKLLQDYSDSIQVLYQTSNEELNMLVQKTKKLRHGSCHYYYNLIQVFQAFYKQTSMMEGVYLPKTEIKLFLNANSILKRDTIYEFEYGLVSKSFTDNINNIYLETEKLEVSTFGKSTEIQKSLKFDIMNSFTNEKRTYQNDFTFKIED